MECTRSLRSGNAIFHHVSYFLGLLHSLFDFLSTKNFAFETDPSAKPLVKISFIYMRIKSHFLIIGFEISLALKQRLERLFALAYNNAASFSC